MTDGMAKELAFRIFQKIVDVNSISTVRALIDFYLLLSAISFFIFKIKLEIKKTELSPFLLFFSFNIFFYILCTIYLCFTAIINLRTFFFSLLHRTNCCVPSCRRESFTSIHSHTFNIIVHRTNANNNNIILIKRVYRNQSSNS